MTISSGGIDNLTGGALSTLSISGAGAFNFNGGTVNAGSVDMDLTNNAGTLASGDSRSLGTTAFTTDRNYSQSSSGTLAIKIGFGGFDTVALSGNGTASLSGYLAVSQTPTRRSTPASGSTYDILTASSITLGTLGIADTTYAPRTFTAALASGNTALRLTANIATPTWAISGSGTWSNSSNWSVAVPNGTGIKAWLGDTGAARTITLDSAITLGTLNLANTGGDTLNGSSITLDAYAGHAAINAGYNSAVNSDLVLNRDTDINTLVPSITILTLAGNISGGGALAKQAPGTLILSGSNTYSGGTVLGYDGGTMKLGSSYGLPYGTSLDTFGISTLDLNGYNATLGSISGSSNIVANGSLTIGTSNYDMTFDGAVSGTGSLAKVGTGALTLTASNTYSGGTTVSAGILQGDTSAIQGNIVNNASLVLTHDDFDDVNDGVTFTGSISGSGSVTKVGIGAITMPSGNSYSGGTILSEGTMIIGADSALGAGNSAVTLSGGTLSITANLAFDANRGIQLSDSDGTLDTGNYTLTVPGVIAGSGSFTKAGLGTLVLSGTNTFSGSAEVVAGTLQLNASNVLSGSASVDLQAFATFDLNNHAATFGALSGSDNSAVLLSGALTLGAENQSSMFDGSMSGTGSLHQTGSGTLWLGGTNTYSGGTTVDAGASLIGDTHAIPGNVTNNGDLTFDQRDDGTFAGIISGNGSLTMMGSAVLTLSATNTYSGNTTMAGGTLAINIPGNLGDGSANNNLVFTGGTLQTTASMAISRTVDLEGDGDTIDTVNHTATFSGVFSGSGGLAKAGTGTLILSASNTYAGDTNVNAGVLQANAANTFSPNSTHYVWSGATLDLNSYDQTIGAIAGNGAVTLSGSLTAGGNNANTTFAGSTSGTGSLTKAGSGTLTLSGTNNHSGNTIVTGGTLAFSSSANLGNGSGTNNLVLDSGGTFQALAASNPNRSLTVNSGGGTIDTNTYDLTLAGVLGSGSLTKNSDGILHVSNFALGGVTVNAGTLHVKQGTGSYDSIYLHDTATSVLSSPPAIGSSAQLDTENNALIVNYGAETTGATNDSIRNLIKNGRNSSAGLPGNWNGNGGITSTYANPASGIGNGTNLAIGYADNAALALITTAGSYTSFGGQTVASTSILVRMTRGADANLDGKVDSGDVTIIAAHFNKPGSGQWCYGDFDYSGSCDGNDVTTLGITYGVTSPVLAPAQFNFDGQTVNLATVNYATSRGLLIMRAAYGDAFANAFEAGLEERTTDDWSASLVSAPTAVPEPSGIGAISLAVLCSLGTRRRKGAKHSPA